MYPICWLKLLVKMFWLFYQTIKILSPKSFKPTNEIIILGRCLNTYTSNISYFPPVTVSYIINNNDLILVTELLGIHWIPSVYRELVIRWASQKWQAMIIIQVRSVQIYINFDRCDWVTREEVKFKVTNGIQLGQGGGGQNKFR